MIADGKNFFTKIEIMKTIKTIIGTTIFFAIIALAACGNSSSDMNEIATKQVNENLRVTLSGADSKLKYGEQTIILTFTDGAGNPVDINAATLNFNMAAMGSMAEMNDAASLTTTGTTGQFKGNLKIQMAGDWTAQITYEGAQTGKTTIPVKAQ